MEYKLKLSYVKKKTLTYQELVLKNTIPIEGFEKRGIEPFKHLSRQMTNRINPLKFKTIDYIIVRVLNRNLNVYNFESKASFDVYVIGTFRTFFNPTLEVAKSFAEFYLEMGILPNVITVPKKELLENAQKYSNKLKNGILLYERR